MGLTADRLRELLDYDPLTGVFTRRMGIKGHAIDDPVGFYNQGYHCAWIDGRPYRCHRMAWLYVYGRWPVAQLDHINGIRDDNRLANLREATNAENGRNSKRKKHNKSGFKGVSWHTPTRKWVAQIMFNKQYKYLGLYLTPEEAHQAYVEAAKKLHGEYARFD